MTPLTRLTIPFAFAFAFVACGASEAGDSSSPSSDFTSSAEVAASPTTVTTTEQRVVADWSTESTPSDYSSPTQITELTGEALSKVETQVRAQGWTDVTTFTEEAFAAQDFDGDFRAWRMILVHNDQDEIVQALIG